MNIRIIKFLMRLITTDIEYLTRGGQLFSSNFNIRPGYDYA